ncbi:hypothetical protein [Nostocoides sp. Soil756]|uniref:hypothetical protein n=1 Tax=Nostocoides sp. Soil756 TaxID=1736399 RepID=UPI0006F271A5|nr:hypothetical protein [Tetrasphaera sp. Soil756]KRE62801.1 hypothetical protein ASG78_07425 [Tetrasphaera sp. Soil756]
MSQPPPPGWTRPPDPGADGPPPPGSVVPTTAATPSSLSRKARFWIGFAVGVPAVPALLVGLLVGVSALSGSGSGSTSTVVSVAAGVLVVALVVAGLVVRATRWLTLGALAGGALVVIVLGGACVAILQGLNA